MPFLALLLTLLAVPVTAESALTVGDAVTYALTHHPELKAVREEEAAAKAAMRGAQARRNPEILVTPGILGSAGSDELFSLTQPLELTGARAARARIATGELEAAHAESRVTERDVALTVRLAYWELMQAQAIAVSDTEHVTHIETLALAAKRRVEMGDAPTSHPLKVEVELARARQQLIRSQAAVVQARTALNASMGREPMAPLMLADPPPFTPLQLSADTLWATGQTQRPELARAEALAIAAGGAVDAARAAKRPDVAVQIRREADSSAGGVGLAISLPVVDWGAARAERERTQALLAAQRQRIEAVRLTIRQEIHTALTAVQSAEFQVRSQDNDVVAPAEKLAALTMMGYQEGAMTHLEVLDARRVARAAHADYAAALGEYHKALARLTWAVGEELR
jgi:cobalt-zinc-cadmium efflux system outer membrane protein